ncbi:GGDEF domain-containing protein [Novosphingobium malaysiense]|uniref:GGDEF domain-containing protein n=1 Tax=Novosphingobium malaysiense TaxID=1348853 RepID=UPI000B32FAA7|nr:diguanylate cyclase [Novosphingobium malaysiense]
MPENYQRGSLWLRADIDELPVDPRNLVLLVHNSRFDRLQVSFTYGDGRVVRQAVKGGTFAAHWRTGGQIAFEAPMRDVPLQFVTMRFDRLASINLLRMRLIDRDEANVQATALSISVAAALTLLLIGALYNSTLAFSLRRQFPVWQAAWAICMLAWGTIWSQLHLFLLPGMAGAVSAQACTALACLAVTLAAFSAVTALDAHILPRSVRRTTLGLAAAVGLFGLPLTFMRQGPIDTMAAVLGILILGVLFGVAFCLAWAWRKGSAEARTFAGAWSLPMLALGSVQFVDTNAIFWGGGSQLMVLFAAAWQTLWLAAAASRTHAQLRIEHDRARRAEAQAHELARRDPLTGLRNRRGFVEAVAPMFELARSGASPLALLLLDIDKFKRINDTYGHDTGDMVLATVARRISRWEGPMCKVARLGGEEFALMVGGMDSFSLARFAQSVRQEIAACDHTEVIDCGTVTVSIGVAEAGPASDFRELYRHADEALYCAKHEGRDRVAFHQPEAPLQQAGDNPQIQAAQ